MKPARFRHYAPTTVDEAVALLARLAPDDGRVLAGGQSLVPTMAFRLARPKHLVDINGVAGLDRLVVENGRLCLGAGAPRSAPCSRRSSGISRITRSAPAAHSAAASPMPIRPPNGARWRRRSTPR